MDTKDYGYSDHRNVGSVKQNLIAVVSLTPGAGSTFFLHNFTRFLSLEHGISSSVLDTPSNSQFGITYLMQNKNIMNIGKKYIKLLKQGPKRLDISQDGR